MTDSGAVTVGATGTGTLTVGSTSTGNGTLNLGTGGTAGTLNAATVTAGSGAAVVNFNQTGSYTFAPQITGSLTVNKLGAGTTVLTAVNGYTGATQITGGTLTLGVGGSINSSASVTVDSGGTLLLAGNGSADRINDVAGVTLAGGTLSMAGLSSSSETMGALTLSANSIIDFGTGSGNTLHFSSLTGLGTYTLRMNGWIGPSYYTLSNDPNGDPTQDRLLFDTGGFTALQLAALSFYDDGNNFLGSGKEILFNGSPAELVPVPEPTTILGGLMLVGLIGYRERRLLRRMFAKV